MKRTRRVIVEIEHRSISISQTESRSSADSDAYAPFMPIACSVCGAPWMLVSPEADAGLESEVQQIFHLLRQRGLHTHFSAAGKLWVCSQSFQHLSENN
jgi:hypothetical protein